MDRKQKNGYSLYSIFSLVLLDVLIDIKISAAIVLSVMIWLFVFLKNEDRLWRWFGKRFFRDRLVNLVIICLYGAMSAFCLVFELRHYFIIFPVFCIFFGNIITAFKYFKSCEKNEKRKIQTVYINLLLYGFFLIICFARVFAYADMEMVRLASRDYIPSFPHRFFTF